MGVNYKVSYGVDLVFCIDATASMSHVLNTIKDNAMHFFEDLTKEMSAKRKSVPNVRVRVVAFRDFLADGDGAIVCSEFFRLPDEAASLRDFLGGIAAEGGGDTPEDGLEALAFAMKSDWSAAQKGQRHIIVVWSDEGTHELGYGKEAEGYPAGMARSFDELTEWWGWGNKLEPGIMDESSKRLILFAPDKPGWSTVRDTWNKVIHYRVAAGAGLKELDYGTILNALTQTM